MTCKLPLNMHYTHRASSAPLSSHTWQRVEYKCSIEYVCVKCNVALYPVYTTIIFDIESNLSCNEIVLQSIME